MPNVLRVWKTFFILSWAEAETSDKSVPSSWTCTLISAWSGTAATLPSPVTRMVRSLGLFSSALEKLDAPRNKAMARHGTTMVCWMFRFIASTSPSGRNRSLLFVDHSLDLVNGLVVFRLPPKPGQKQNNQGLEKRDQARLDELADAGRVIVFRTLQVPFIHIHHSFAAVKADLPSYRFLSRSFCGLFKDILKHPA